MAAIIAGLELATTAEAGKEFGHTGEAVRQMIRRDELKGYRIGRNLYVDMAEVRARGRRRPPANHCSCC